MITTRAMAAHHRLLVAGLPSRRHEWRPRRAAPRPCSCPPPEVWNERREQVRRLRKTMTYRAMAEHLGISKTAVANHVRAIKAERRRRR